MGGEVTTLTGALDERIKYVIPFGFSPDMNVVRYHDNHQCWRFMNSNFREYYDVATWVFCNHDGQCNQRLCDRA